MKTTRLALMGLLFACTNVHAQMQPKAYNFHTFSASQKDITDELRKLVPLEFQSHPEFGILPYNAPCEDCYELIHERTDSTRMFVGKGEQATTFYSQAAYGKLNYTDANGHFISYNPRIKPTYLGSSVFESAQQDFPIKIDASVALTSFTLPNGQAIELNKNLGLVHQSESGNITNLGPANWSDYTVGDDGIKIIEVWPGIDIEIKVALGQLKTDYIVKSNPGFADGYLVITDHFNADENFTLEMHEIAAVDFQTGAQVGTACILNENEEGLYIEPAFGYDHTGSKENTKRFGYKIQEQNLELWIPVSWINTAGMQFPLTIDPSVTSSATYTAGIMRFRFDGSACFGLGVDCAYVLNVPRPANSTLTGATFSIVHETVAGFCAGCWMSEAGFYFETTCGLDGYWGCNTDAAGTCTGTNLDFSALVTCLPPACSGNVPFTIYNSYCYCSTGGNCGISCQRINNNTWIITLVGTTLETLSNTVTGNGSQTINDADCVGTALLNPTGSGGVPAYTYNWSTGATTSTVTVGVTPAIYTCTVTDACGVSRVATFNIGCPLTLRLDHLTAVPGDKGIDLSWKSYAESGMQKFVVQRLYADGSLEEVASIDASGTESGNMYHVTDQHPQNGLNYYRLLVYYESGEQEATETVSAFYEPEQVIRIIPNPNNGNFEIQFNAENGTESYLEIIDLSGKTVYAKTLPYITENVIHALNGISLTAGIYTLKINTGTNVLSERLVIR